MITIRVTAEPNGGAVWLDNHGQIELVAHHPTHELAMQDAQALRKEIRRELQAHMEVNNAQD